MNKNGIFEGTKSLLSLVIGLVLSTFGMLHLLNVKIPAIPEVVLAILLAIGGFYLIIDGLIQHSLGNPLGWLSMIIGILVASMGMISLLNSLGLIQFKLSFVTAPVMYILFLITGVLLILGAFML